LLETAEEKIAEEKIAEEKIAEKKIANLVKGETRGGRLGSFSFAASLQIVTNDAYVRWDSGRALNLVAMASSLEGARSLSCLSAFKTSLMIFW